SAAVCVGELNEACLEQHADVEVQVTGIDPETLCELAVRELPVAFLAEHLEDAHAQRMSQRLELLRLVEYQRCVLHVDPPFVCPGAVLHIEGGLSSGQLGCSSAIEDCSGPPVRGPNEAGRGLGARSLGECPPRSVRLLRAAECEDDHASAGQRRYGESDAIDEWLEPGLRRQDASLLLQCRSIREQRRDVAVGPDAEQREVENRVAELAFVVVCRALLAELAL